MKYINMNEVSFYANDIVFPGLGNCHGVIYETNIGLFGFHIFGAAYKTEGGITTLCSCIGV